MKIHLKAFGVARDILGSTTELEIPGNTVRELRQALYATFPDFKGLNSLMVAVNQRYAEDDLQLLSTDEIALIPPVSGG
jgi:molybdopterin converting factor subunit 1